MAHRACGRGTARRKPCGRLILLLVTALSLLPAAGCATRRYVGPTTGRSADMQKAASMALDNAVGTLAFTPYAGRSVFVEVVTLAENYGGESPESAVIRGAIAEKLTGDGLTVRTDPAGADLRLAVRARVVGVDVVRRDFPPFYYRETTKATVDLHATVYSAADWKILAARDARARLRLAQSYWFYIIGPFESLRWE